MQISKRGIGIILTCLIIGLGTGFLSKNMDLITGINNKDKLQEVTASDITPNPTSDETESSSNDNSNDNLNEINEFEDEFENQDEKINTESNYQDEASNIDSNFKEGTGVVLNKSDKTLSNVDLPNDYVLISGLAASQNLQNVLIGLYNIKSQEIIYLPYDYYVKEYQEYQNILLGSLTIDQIRDYLGQLGINITKQILVDQDIVFDLFGEIMSGDQEYVISYTDDKSTKINVPIKTKAHLYNLLSKDNLNQFGNLEQLHNIFLNLLIQNNLEFGEVLGSKDTIELSPEQLYTDGKFNSITSKEFKKEQIDGKFFSVDAKNQFIKILVNGDLTKYQDILDKPVVKEPVVKKESAIEKIKRLKAEKKAKVTEEKISETTTGEKESAIEKIRRLKAQNKKL